MNQLKFYVFVHVCACLAAHVMCSRMYMTDVIEDVHRSETETVLYKMTFWLQSVLTVSLL